MKHLFYIQEEDTPCFMRALATMVLEYENYAKNDVIVFEVKYKDPSDLFFLGRTYQLLLYAETNNQPNVRQ